LFAPGAALAPPGPLNAEDGMIARTVVFTSLAWLALSAGKPTSGPVTTRYRIETVLDQTVDLSGVGQGEQKQSLTQLALISVTLTDSGGGKVMHVVVDSVALESPVPTPPGALQALKGAWLHGYIDPQGHTSMGPVSLDTSDVLGQLKAALLTFHPRLKPGFKAGDSWSDTAQVETKTQSAQNKTTVVTTYTAGPEETVAGANARRLETTFSATSSGKIQNPMAGEMDLESTETGTGVYFVGSDGRFLGGTSTGTGNAKVSSPTLPEVIPVKTSRKSSITVLK
jgi:hypothetical protein